MKKKKRPALRPLLRRRLIVLQVAAVEDGMPGAVFELQVTTREDGMPGAVFEHHGVEEWLRPGPRSKINPGL